MNDKRLVLPLILLISTQVSFAQTTLFNFQGQLNQFGLPVLDGLYDFEFHLYTNATSGTEVAAPSVANALPVKSGLFSLKLDFGAAFGDYNGTYERFLEIHIATNGFPLATLLPRQPVLPTPDSGGFL